MKAKKMYKDGGKAAGKKLYATGGKISPEDHLKMMTANRLREELRKAGVAGKYSIGTGGKLMADKDYDELVKIAKQKGVYQFAREKAVADFRNEYKKVDAQ